MRLLIKSYFKRHLSFFLGGVNLKFICLYRLVDTHGPPLHHGGDSLRPARTGTLVPWQVRYLVAFAPDFPRVCVRRRLGPLPWHIGDGHAQGDHRAVRNAGERNLLSRPKMF